MSPAPARSIEEKGRPASEPEGDFSLAEDPLLKVQRALHLVPSHGFGCIRRCLALVVLTWAPIAVWAVATGHFRLEIQGDPVLQHLGIHVRCLLAIPLLVMCEPLADNILRRIVGHFEPSGLIRAEDRGRFAALIQSVKGWRDSRVAWAAIGTIVVVISLLASQRLIVDDPDALIWTPGGVAFDFGAQWGLFVVRPVFLFLQLVWVWRLVVTWILFSRIARLDLALIPSHPDRVGGLGFVDLHSAAFTPVVFATSSVACAAVAHRVLAHGAKIADFNLHLGALVVVLVVLFLLPLTAFSRKLWRVNMRSRFEYGTLAGRHVRGLHQRWIENRAVEDKVLSAPEIGPAADVATLFAMATNMRFMPLRRGQIVNLLLAAGLPVLCVVAIEFPINDMLLSLLKMIG